MRIAAGRVAHRVLTAQALRRVKRLLPEVADPRVTVVLVGWDPVQTRLSLDLVTAWAKRTAVTMDRVMVVWNNPGRVAPDLPGATVVTGSNEELDIGGYAEGMRAVRRLEGDVTDRVWLMCNDRLAFYEPQRPVLGALGPPAVGLACSGCLMGWVMTGDPPVLVHDPAIEAFMQTHCFMFGGSIGQIMMCDELLSVAPASSVRLVDGRFIADANIRPAFLDRLTEVLIVHPDPQPNWQWPGARELEHSDVRFLEKKARSIVVEHLMAAAWCEDGTVVAVQTLPDVLAGYRALAPGSLPLVQCRVAVRLWWRFRRPRFPSRLGWS